MQTKCLYYAEVMGRMYFIKSTKLQFMRNCKESKINFGSINDAEQNRPTSQQNYTKR